MANNLEIFIPQKDNSMELNWGILPCQYWGPLALIYDVFCLEGRGVLGLEREKIHEFRQYLELFITADALEELRIKSEEAILSMKNQDHKNALLTRYPLDGNEAKRPRRTFTEVAQTLGITKAQAYNRTVWGGIQELRSISDIRPIDNIFTIPGFSRLGNHRAGYI